MEKKILLYINFKLYLKVRYEVERHIAYVNMSYGKFVTDWYCYKNVFDSQN